MKTHMYFCFFLLFFSLVIPLFGETSSLNNPSTEIVSETNQINQLLLSELLKRSENSTPKQQLTTEQQIQIALSMPDYPVTSGDTYQVTYYATGTYSGSLADNLVTLILNVDSTYLLKVGSLGTLNASKKTFLQIKSEIETLVAKNYSLSGVQVLLKAVGSFKIKMTGEVQKAGEVVVNSVTRLSSLLDKTTENASLRNVQVTSANGTVNTYDLLQANRYGILEQDPYLRPNDSVYIPKSTKKITLNGHVARPGVYDLLENEGLQDLIVKYGEGFTDEADLLRITIVRVNPVGIEAEKFFINYTTQQEYTLINGDTIEITSKNRRLPRVYFEGALLANIITDQQSAKKTTQETQNGQTKTSVGDTQAVQNQVTHSGQNKFEKTIADVQPIARIDYLLYGNDTVGNAALDLQDSFYSASDLQNAYIKRGMLNIPVDLSRFLFHNDFSHDVSLESGDTVIVPFKQFYVQVVGAVRSPGRFPYIPDKTVDFYINLAGGYNPEYASSLGVKITDSKNNKLAKNALIPPETTISVPITSGVYYINKYSGVVLTIASIVTTIFALKGLFTP